MRVTVRGPWDCSLACPRIPAVGFCVLKNYGVAVKALGLGWDRPGISLCWPAESPQWRCTPSLNLLAKAR